MKTWLIIIIASFWGISTMAQDKAMLKKRIEQLEKQHLADSLTIDSLSRTLDTLSVFRQEFVKQRLVSQCPDLALPCSKADINTLTDYEQKLEPFIKDAEVGALYQRVNTYKALCKEYVLLRQPLTLPLDYTEAERCYNRLLELKDRTGISKSQSDEFFETARLLSKYPLCADIVKGIISNITEQLDPYQGSTNDEIQSMCIELVNNIVAKAESNDPGDKPRYIYIKDIPYLNERYSRYLSNMRTKPLNITEEVRQAIDEINNIKTH